MSVWTIAAARDWSAGQPWRLGCNFIPSTAVNALEMWQAATFDPATIDRELALAAATGMNAARVFLHDLLWLDDAAGLLDRIEVFLGLADRHGLATMPVLFESCWNPAPRPGPQPAPRPGVHNSQWVQSPGMAALANAATRPRLEAYVGGVVGRFARDRRVFAWDVWNEPDNGPEVATADPVALAAKAAHVLPLLGDAFDWVRAAGPVQPLTSALWVGDWSARDRLSPIQQVQLDGSDIVSFHNYGPPDDFAARMAWLAPLGRPIMCTEFMARPRGSSFAAIAPLGRAAGVGLFCWGLVRGRTQTHLPWDSWDQPYLGPAPDPWFHDVFDTDLTPYDATETALLRRLADA